jgi:hypothetical protein
VVDHIDAVLALARKSGVTCTDPIQLRDRAILIVRWSPTEQDLACLAEGRHPVSPPERSQAFDVCAQLRRLQIDALRMVFRPGAGGNSARKRLVRA